MGGGYVSLLDDEAGRAVHRRALELGVNYFDGRYGNSNGMLRPLIAGRRDGLVLVTKTAEDTAAGAMGRIEEDLEELGTDHLDVFYLRTYSREMLERHFAPGGSVEGVLAAKRQGKVRALGLAGHSDLRALASGIETGAVDACMFPLNLGRTEGLTELVPAAERHDVGLAVMKPMAVGLAPAEVALRWLARRPVHVIVPGVSTVEQLELDARILGRARVPPSEADLAEEERWQRELARSACHICDRLCQPRCEARVPIDVYLYHDVFLNQLRALGLEGFLAAPLADRTRAAAEEHFAGLRRAVAGCTRCGACEEACPYGLPIVRMLEERAAACEEAEAAVARAGWKARFAGSAPAAGRKKKEYRS